MTIKERVKGLGPVEKRRVQIEIGKEIVKMIESDMSNSDIAKETGLSESSIRSLRHHHEIRKNK